MKTSPSRVTVGCTVGKICIEGSLEVFRLAVRPVPLLRQILAYLSIEHDRLASHLRKAWVIDYC